MTVHVAFDCSQTNEIIATRGVLCVFSWVAFVAILNKTFNNK